MIGLGSLNRRSIRYRSVRVAQLVARFLDMEKVTGSSPVANTKFSFIPKIKIRNQTKAVFVANQHWGSSHFMVGVRLKAANNKHLAVSVGNFRTTYIRKPFSGQALRRY